MPKQGDFWIRFCSSFRKWRPRSSTSSHANFASLYVLGGACPALTRVASRCDGYLAIATSSLDSHQTQWIRVQMASFSRSVAGNRNGFCPLGKTQWDCLECRWVFSCWRNNWDSNKGYFHLLHVSNDGLKIYVWHFGYLQLAILDSSSYSIQGKVLKCSALQRCFGFDLFLFKLHWPVVVMLSETFCVVVPLRDSLSEGLCGPFESSVSKLDPKTGGLSGCGSAA